MWFSIQDKQIKLYIIAKPHAKKTAIVKINEQGLHIAIHAKPHKGEANKVLILFLSTVFDIPKTSLTLIAGETSRHKQILMPLTAHIQKILGDLSVTFSRD